MLKRSLAVLLWFYAGWYAGALIAYHLGISDILGPVLGTAAAALIAVDPRRIIWVAQVEEVEASAAPSRTTAPDPA
jgi:hypothetical protein